LQQQNNATAALQQAPQTMNGLHSRQGCNAAEVGAALNARLA